MVGLMLQTGVRHDYRVDLYPAQGLDSFAVLDFGGVRGLCVSLLR